jgi:hypothetical protein
MRSFLDKNRELANSELWREFYSEETWWSADARENFVLPDLKELDKCVMRKRED